MIDGLDALGIYAGTFILAVISGIVPIVNAELYLVGVSITTGNTGLAIVLGIIVALGQMVAKVTLYQTARSASNLGKRKSAKYEAKLARARALMERWRDKPYVLLVVSAIFGLPPFMLVAIASGMLELPFKPFLIIGVSGRIVRFVTIALLALLV